MSVVLFISGAAESRTVRLGDRFEFRESDQLGKGGYGIVFKGKNVHERTDVAVKRMEINTNTKKYVTREKDLIEKCNFRHVVQIFAAIHLSPFMYFVLEYCTQGSLNQFYKKQTERVSFGQNLNFMGDITYGIRYLHKELKMCHRDVTPANILAQDDNVGSGVYMKIGDFGLARDFPESGSAISSVSGNVGTDGWRAPDISQCTDGKYNYFPADIFSVALVFLAMLKHQLGNFLQPHKGISVHRYLINVCLDYLFVISFNTVFAVSYS